MNFLMLVALVAGGLPGAALADGIVMVRPAASNTGSTAVVGGTKAVVSEWPASFIYKTGQTGCTATAVGDRVILTAAHCVLPGQSAIVETPAGDVPLHCDRHPNYTANFIPADFALCLADSVMHLPSYETVGTSIAHPRLGEQVVMLGFGCVQAHDADQTFGTLYRGTAPVKQVPVSNAPWVMTQGQQALCKGDSGGGGYFYTTTSSDKRLIFGIASEGNLTTDSYFAITASPVFVDWAVSWTRSKQVAICGINVEALRCHL